jgi:hypothetical protein
LEGGNTLIGSVLVGSRATFEQTVFERLLSGNAKQVDGDELEAVADKHADADEEKNLQFDDEEDVVVDAYAAIADLSESAEESLFSFELTLSSGALWTSIGTWHSAGGRSHRFQMLVTSPIAFIVNVFELGARGELIHVHTISAKKVVNAPEQSFLQKYGMMLAIGGFMIINSFLKSRQATAQAPPVDGEQEGGERTEQGTVEQVDGDENDKQD